MINQAGNGDADEKIPGVLHGNVPNARVDIPIRGGKRLPRGNRLAETGI
jgi:hypothetical protein